MSIFNPVCAFSVVAFSILLDLELNSGCLRIRYVTASGIQIDWGSDDGQRNHRGNCTVKVDLPTSPNDDEVEGNADNLDFLDDSERIDQDRRKKFD